MHTILYVLFLGAIFCTYQLAAIMAFGKKTELQSQKPPFYLKWIDGGDNSTHSQGTYRSWIRKAVSILGVFAFFAGMITGVIYMLRQEFLAGLFHKFQVLLMWTGLYMVSRYLCERSGMKDKLFLFPISLSVSVTATYFTLHYPNWLSFSLVTLSVCAALLFVLRNITRAQFWIVSIGIMAFDVYGVFLTDQIITAIDGSSGGIRGPLPFGLIFLPQDFSLSAQPILSLGAGDIIFPGLLMMIAYHETQNRSKLTYYLTGLGYVIGLVVAIVVMIIMQQPQPATIYLIPGVLLGYYTGRVIQRS